MYNSAYILIRKKSRHFFENTSKYQILEFSIFRAFSLKTENALKKKEKEKRPNCQLKPRK
jgi:hypothetical protein